MSADQLIMICPSDDFWRSYRLEKSLIAEILGRSSSAFERPLVHCVKESQRLADEFHELINGPDPLAGAIRL